MISSCVAVVVGLSALGQVQQAGVALMPLSITRPPVKLKPAELDDLNAVVKRVVRGDGVVLQSSARVQEAIEGLKRSDCASDDSCLGGFALSADSLYGIFVTIDYTVGKEVVVSGRVVRNDGKVVRPLVTTRLPPSKAVTYLALVKLGLEQLFQQLDLKGLPVVREAVVEVKPLEPVKPVEVAPAPVVDAGVAYPAPPPPQLEDSPLKPVGLVAAVVGGVAAVAGVTMFVIGRGAASQVYDSSGLVVPGASAEQVRTANTLQPLGVGLMAGGAVVGIGGVVLALMSGNDRSKGVVKTSVVMMPGGAGVMLRGELP